MRTVLCVEDELDILENNRDILVKNVYHVLTALNLAQARERLAAYTPDAIILDIVLPDGNGLDLLRELRGQGSKVPVLILTAWGEPHDVERGLELGANDYMSKPFTYGVLLARVETMFRNVEQIPEQIKKGAITLKIRSMEVCFAGKKARLPPVEFYLLQFFIENEGKDLKAEYLYEKVWGTDMNDDPNAVRITVKRLREKIAGSGYAISTVYGGGYRFEAER